MNVKTGSHVKIGSLVKFYTILLLGESSKCGYELMKKLEEKLGRTISTSQVYPFLNSLEKNKIIVVETIGERDKKTYKLTKNGKEFVNGFLQRFGDLLHTAIKPKLTICAHCGCKVYDGGHKERIKNKTLMFCCYHCAKFHKNNFVKSERY